MNSRVLMIASSAFLAAAGLATTFVPDELLHALHLPSTQPLPLLISLLGALYLGFAIMNWTARGKIIGGIYARPLSLGNFCHFMVGAITLLKHQLAYGFGGPLTVVAACYAAFALGFGSLMFGTGTPNSTR